MTVAAADQHPRRPWPIWRQAAAYILLALVAAASVWFIDRDAVRVGPSTAPTDIGLE